MSQPVNLNKVRKARARAEKQAQANENAVRFGQTKAKKARDAAQKAAEVKHLDGHKREP